MFSVTPLAIPELLEIVPQRHGDARGWLAETWNRARFAGHGIAADFVQDNLVRTAAALTLRGLHYQAPPRSQGKLISVLAGSILDVAVDLRRGSGSYGRHQAVILSTEAGNALWVPPGFAHGYCTLQPDSLVAYKVTDYWSPEHEYGLSFDDPALGIEWPAPADGERLLVNDRDLAWPLLADLDSPFVLPSGLLPSGPARA
ncbi:MAG: dTDP-4-dehydrorhamnose 3,5-epimerase [Sneathiellaceae bacterium]